MINFHFHIKNPWSKEWENKNLNWHGKILRNKYLKIELSNTNFWRFFNFELSTNWRGYDHAGPEFTIGLLGFEFNIHIYDQRHWDYVNNKWENYK